MADDSGANSENIGAIDVSIGADYSSLQSAFQSVQDQAEQAGESIASSFNQGTAAITTGADSAESALSSMAEQMVALGEALAITEGLKDFGAEALAASDSITTANIALTTMTGDAGQAAETIEGLEQLGMADGLAMPSLLTAAQRMTAMLPPGTDVVGLLGDIANGAAVMGTSIDRAATMFDRMVDSGTTSARALQALGLSLPSLSAALNAVAGSSVSTADTVTAMFKALDDQGRIAVLQQALSNLGGVAQQVAQQTFGGEWQSLADAWEGVMVQVGQAITPVVSDLLDLTKTDIVPFLQGLVADFNALPGPVKDTAVGVALLVAALVPITGIAAAAAIGFNGLVAAATQLGIVSGETALSTGAEAEAAAAAGTAAAVATPEIEAQAVAVEEAGAAATEAAAQYDLFAHSVVSADWGAEASQMSLFADSEVAAGEGAGAMGAAMSLAATGGVLVLAGAFGSLLGAYLAWKNRGEEDAQQTAQLMATVDALTKALTAHGVAFQSLVDQYNNGQITLQGLVEKLQGLDTEWQNSVSATQNAANNSILLAGALKTLTDAVQTSDTAYTNSLAVYGAVVQSLQTQAPLYKTTAAGIDALMQSQENLISTASKTAEGLSSTTVALAADSLAAEKASLQYTATEGAYQQLLAGAQAGTATWGQVEAAYTKVQAAETAMANAGTPVAGTLQAINQQAAASVDSMSQLATSEQLAADQTTAEADNLTALSAQAIVAQQKLDLLVQEQAKLQAAVNSGLATQQQLNTLLGQIATSANQAQEAANKLATAQLNAGNSAAIAGGNVGVLRQELDAANLSLDQQTQKANAGQISITAWASAQKAATTAAVNLAVGIAEQAADADKAVDPMSELAVAYAGATAKMNALVAAFQAGKAALSDVASAQNAALNAQIAYDQAQAVMNAGLSDVTDQLGLLAAAVVAAQAKVNDLSNAQQQGAQVGSQLLAAEQSLTSAQNALTTAQNAGTTATNAGTTATNALSIAQQNLANTAPTVTTAMGNQAAQLLQDVTAMQSLAQAAQGVEQDFQNAIGSATTGGTISGGGAGTRVSQTGIGEFGQPIYSTTYTPNLTQEQFDALVDHYGLAFAQNVEKNYNAIGYSDNYSPSVVTSTSGSTASASSSGSTSGGVSVGTGTDNSPIITGGTVTLPGSTTSTTGSTATTPTETLAQAQAGVTAAQNAIVAAMESASTTAAQMAELQVILAQAQDTLQAIEQGNTSTTAASTSSTTPTSSSGAGTGAVDGGSYPAVTAHQAAGEIWAVSGSGTASAGGTVATGSTSSVTENITSTVASTGSDQTQALGQVVSAIGGAVEQLAIFTGDFLPATQNLANIASAVGGLVRTVTTGPISTTPAGGSNSATGSGSHITTGGSAVSIGTPTTIVPGGASSWAGATGPTQSAPINNVPGYNPFGPTGVTTPSSGSTASNNVQAQVSVDMRGSNFGGTTQAQMVSVISAAVTQSMVDSLRAAGARF